jgi:cysteine desulfurase
MTKLGARRNGEEPRAPHVTNVSFEDMRGDELVSAFDVEGVCLSGGSACSAGSPEASSVVSAMLGAQRGAGAVRASLGEETGEDELSRAIEAIRRVIGRARGHG